MTDTLPKVPFGDCTLQLCSFDRALYPYVPSLGANACFLAFFAFILLFHAVSGVIWKTWFYSGAMVFGCSCAAVGYAGRVISHENPFKLTSFLIQICCLTMAPAYFSAAIYYCLSQIIAIFTTKASRIRPIGYTIIFCGCDLVSLTLQGTGGGLASVSSEANEDPYFGDTVMLAGLSSQVFSLLLFLGVCGEYFMRIRSKRFELNPKYANLRSSFRFRGCLATLLLAAILILIRSVYRVMELSQGWKGLLISIERLFIVFEGIMVLLATILLTLFPPSMCFRDDQHSYQVPAIFKLQGPSQKGFYHSAEQPDVES